MVTLGTAAIVGVGSSAVMATTSQRTAQQTHEAVNVFGLSTAALAGTIGAFGLGATESTAFGEWAKAGTKLTGLPKSGQLLAASIGIAAGVGMADLAASMVLHVNDKSFVGNSHNSGN